MIYVINLCQSGLVIMMDVSASVGKNWEIRDEGNKGQAKKAKTKQCFVGGFCFRCTFPEKLRIHTKTPVGNNIAK